ncbi:MAG TPA: hypothetical protein VGF45_12350, partial [Polyangia bacterium]
FLVGDSAAGDRLFEEARARARNRLDGLEVLGARVALFQTVGRFQDALSVGRVALAEFGVTLFDEPEAARAALATEKKRHDVLSAGRPIEAFADLPLATDREVQLFTALVADLTPALYLTRACGLPALILGCVNRTLEAGLTPQSAKIFVDHALLLSAANDHAQALAWADVAVRANQHHQSARYTGRVHFIRSCLVAHWRRPFRETLREMERAFDATMQVGDLAFVSYVGMGQIGHWIASGRPLDEVLAVADRALAAMRGTPSPSVEAGIRLQRQFAICLRGRTRGPTSFSDDEVDEEASLATITAGAFGSAITGHHILKAIVAYLHGAYAEAAEHLSKATLRLQDLMASAIGALHPIFHALIAAAPLPAGSSGTPGEGLAAKAALEAALAGVRPLVHHCPENFSCRQSLLEAELARLEGRTVDALRGYEAAIAAARANDLVMFECIACEAALRFHVALGLPRVGQRYLRAARAAYVRWGADAKLPSLTRLGAALNGGAVDGTGAASGEIDRLPSTTEPPQNAAGVDLARVIRASQALSEQMHPERLIEALLNGVLTLTSATRVALIEPSGAWLQIHGDAERDVDGHVRMRTETTPVAPDGLAE